ncbi:MAG: RluA family pseudouridine synthase [Peptococcaceae bacterium]|nr:RluA family pseudouridine synthase [Peptococcaceae bacterium]
MDIFELQITAEENGTRLDSFLADELEEISRSYIQKLIADQMILVNQKAVKANYKVKTNDQLLVQIPEAAPVDIQPEPMDLDIVYEDSDLLIVNKPVGLVVHPAHGHYSGTLVNGLLAHCNDLSGINGKMRPGIVHRIDKDTSGLLMIAKNDLAHQHLAAQLKDHSIRRAYYALVQGVISEPAGLVDAPIGRHEVDRKKMAVTFKNSKEARTHYYVKERFARNTFIECRLETGRTHQIRVHMSYLGHPLVGDPLYGTRKNNLDFPGQALHAYALGFVHPRTGEELYFEAPMPEHFQSVLKTLAQGD